MNISQRITIAWAAQRVSYLDSLKKFEHSYAVSQEFCEWTTCLNVYPEGLKAAKLNVPDFKRKTVLDNQRNRKITQPE